MAQSVGVRELKENPSKYLRQVQEQHEEFEITIRGRAVARLVPLEHQISDAERQENWRRHRELAAELSQFVSEPFSAVEAIREQRRDL
jgi:prevent-host-death family protein